MFTVDFNKFKYKDGFYFTLTFMHGDADYYTTVRHYIRNVEAAKDFCEMLCEIKGKRSLPMNHLYWLNEFRQEDRENLEYWFEDEGLVDKILNAHLPDNSCVTEDIIQKVNFTVPFDDLEYTNYLAALIDIDITCVMCGSSYNVKFN